MNLSIYAAKYRAQGFCSLAAILCWSMFIVGCATGHGQKHVKSLLVGTTGDYAPLMYQ